LIRASRLEIAIQVFKSQARCGFIRSERDLGACKCAQAAVNQLRVPAACTRGEVILLDECDAQSRIAQHQVPRDPCAIDAAPYDEHVPVLIA
jgi:hypothetical protein